MDDNTEKQSLLTMIRSFGIKTANNITVDMLEKIVTSINTIREEKEIIINDNEVLELSRKNRLFIDNDMLNNLNAFSSRFNIKYIVKDQMDKDISIPTKIIPNYPVLYTDRELENIMYKLCKNVLNRKSIIKPIYNIYAILENFSEADEPNLLRIRFGTNIILLTKEELIDQLNKYKNEIRYDKNYTELSFQKLNILKRIIEKRKCYDLTPFINKIEYTHLLIGPSSNERDTIKLINDGAYLEKANLSSEELIKIIKMFNKKRKESYKVINTIFGNILNKDILFMINSYMYIDIMKIFD